MKYFGLIFLLAMVFGPLVYAASYPVNCPSNGGTQALNYTISNNAYQCGAIAPGTSVAISNTTSNLTYYPLFATSTSSAATTIFTTIPSYTFNPSTGTLSALALTTTTLTVNGNSSLSGTTTANNLVVTGTCTNCGGGTPATPNLSIQYDNSGSFGSATGLFYSTTRQGIDFLAAVTTANLLSLPDNGLDITSIAIGPSALLAQTVTNLENVAVGYQALKTVTISNFQTAMGYQALSSTDGTSNTGVGYQAGKSITNGYYNTVIGRNADVSGANFTNVVVGAVATSSGSQAVVVGYNAAGSANDAIIVGENGQAGMQSLAFGSFARANGTNATAIGYNAQASGNNSFSLGQTTGSHVTGPNNIMIGSAVASTTLVTGSFNIIFGTSSATDTALSNTSTAVIIGGKGGSFDTGIGIGTLASVTTNALNSAAIGYNALNAVTTGTNNTALGYKAGNLITVGGSNTIIGNSVASTTLTIGSGNILLGASSALDTTTSSTSHVFSVGDNATHTLDCTAINTSTPACNFPGTLTVAGSTVSTAASGSGAEQTISYQPGLLSAVNATKGVYGKFVKASTVDNIEGSAITFSCIANPTITLTNCHTDTSCATSPTAIGTVTVTAAGQAFDGSITSASILANEYVAWAITAGTCASIDISATAQIHAN